MRTILRAAGRPLQGLLSGLMPGLRGVLMAGLATGLLAKPALSAEGAQSEATVQAQTQAPAAADGACIDTEVNGYRALSYDCLNQKMAPDKRAGSSGPTPGLESEAATRRAPNQLGLPTPATIGNRMGNTFGTSAYPQRPQP